MKFYDVYRIISDQETIYWATWNNITMCKELLPWTKLQDVPDRGEAYSGLMTYTWCLNED